MTDKQIIDARNNYRDAACAAYDRMNAATGHEARKEACNVLDYTAAATTLGLFIPPRVEVDFGEMRSKARLVLGVQL
jgi:hypothetical protein